MRFIAAICSVWSAACLIDEVSLVVGVDWVFRNLLHFYRLLVLLISVWQVCALHSYKNRNSIIQIPTSATDSVTHVRISTAFNLEICPPLIFCSKNLRAHVEL